MIDYSLGKIYKIVGNGLIYVGSSCRPLLSQRLATHKYGYKSWLGGKGDKITSFECITDPECYIELLELCPSSCIDELKKCEAKWIRELECVNKCMPCRTKKEYREDNKDKIKAYRLANRDKNREYAKRFRDKQKNLKLENGTP